MLPQINDTPKYELEIPSSGEKMKFRPYLVKEEKVLLVAAESKDLKQMMDSIIETVKSCSNGKLDTKNLTTFDLEYLFIKLRARSVGETSTLNVKCQHCEKENEYELNLDDIKCTKSETSNMVKLNDQVSIEMKYPSYNTMEYTEDDEDMGFHIVSNSMNAVITEEERIEVKDESPENIRNFLESLTKEQFQKITNFLRDIPKVSCDIDFDCTSCGEHTHIELRGIQDFF